MANMMRIEKLKAQRDVIDTSPLPIPLEELITRYEALFSGAINDVLREHALTDQALPHNIIPLRPEMKVCGVAFTIKSTTDPTVEGELVKRAEMLDSITPGSFCIWDTGGDDESAHWGEMMTAASKAHGARAAAVNGGLRGYLPGAGPRFPRVLPVPHLEWLVGTLQDDGISEAHPHWQSDHQARRYRVWRY